MSEGFCLSHTQDSGDKDQVLPVRGHSWGAQCGCLDPTPLEEEPSPGPGIRRSLTAGRYGLWPCRPRRGRSTKKKRRLW